MEAGWGKLEYRKLKMLSSKIGPKVWAAASSIPGVEGNGSSIPVKPSNAQLDLRLRGADGQRRFHPWRLEKRERKTENGLDHVGHR
nr:unnamed protein product [Digitaria exilis]